MAISEQEFKDLKQGDRLIDGRDDTWHVRQDAVIRDGAVHCMIRQEGYGIDDLRWSNMRNMVGIIDEEIALVDVLNHPDARVEKAS